MKTDVFDSENVGGDENNDQVSLLFVGWVVTEKSINVEAFR